MIGVLNGPALQALRPSRGKAILLISSDMPEMVRLADRILIMKQGRIVAEVQNSRVYREMSESIMQVLA